MEARARQAWSAARPKDPPFDTACIAPWVSLEFDPAGWVYACCTSQLYPLGRIGEQRLSELWNGERAQVLRSALRRWDMSVACQPCRFHLEHERTDPAAAVYDQYPLTDDHPATPYMMLFALSNRCNLGCIMCSPALSSTLQAEAGMPPLKSPYGDEFFEDLEPLLAGLGVAKFLGGEPFLSPEHKRIWSMLDRLAEPPKLSVTTNGTIWTDTVDWLTDRFTVDISVSVDAASAETYASVRRGGDLADVHRNMDRFAERCRQKGANLHVSYCLMPQNAHELGRFLVWAEQYTFGAPAYVNLVTDEGVALHDLPTADLRELRSLWADQDRSVAPALDRNAEVWRTQRDQLDLVIRERESGGLRGSTRAHAAPSAAIEVADLETTAGGDLAAEVERLREWAGGDAVGVVRCTGASVAEVMAPHERLGVTHRSGPGRTPGELLSAAAAREGRDVYELDRDVGPSRAVHTFVLSVGPPTRGAEGAVVRLVQLRDVRGDVFLMAVDDMYDLEHRRATPVEVALRSPATSVAAIGGGAG